MNDDTEKLIFNATGETVVVLLGWAWKALMVWWCFPIVVQRLLPRFAADGWIQSAPGYAECFLLVYLISMLRPIKTIGVTRPMKVKIDDDKS